MGRRQVPGLNDADRRSPRGRSGPSWAPSAGRSPGTRSSTCCRSTAATWRRRWSAPRAPWASSSTPPCELVPISPARVLVVLGYPDMAAAADAVPALLTHCPLAVEGLDARLVDVVRRRQGRRGGAGPAARRGLADDRGRRRDARRGNGFGAAAGSGRRRARRGDHARRPGASTMWQIRADGAGLAGRTPDGRQAWPGWEDAAVPPAQPGRLPAGVRDSDGVVPVDRLAVRPFRRRLRPRPHRPPAGARAARCFASSSGTQPDLVVRHGGSCSGEHGDGRARSELLPIMYSRGVIDLFGGVKALFDPDDLLNPGVLVRPAPDRRGPAPPAGASALPSTGGFRFAHDDGDFTRAVHRCVGVGKCRADTTAAGGFMCPSYLASKDEKDVTRGRARVLQELTNGSTDHRLVRSRGARVARPVPVLQGLRQRLPGRRRHGAVQVGGAVPHLPRQAAARQPLHARPAAALARRPMRPDRTGRSGCCQPGAGRPTALVTLVLGAGASIRGGARHRFAHRDLPPAAGGAERAHRSGPSAAHRGIRWCCGPTPSPTA